jgi:peptidoglycan hydrolase CwlO-like protein
VLYSLNNTRYDVSSDVTQVTRRSLQVQQFEQELYAAAAAEQRQAHAREQCRLQKLAAEAAAAQAAAAAAVRDTSVQTDTVVQVVPQPEAPGAFTIS